MKPAKMTSVLLSVVLSISMVMTPVGVAADDSAPSEEQTSETTETMKETETKASEKPTVKETEKTDNEDATKPDETIDKESETTVTEPTEEKSTEPNPTEEKVTDPTKEATAEESKEKEADEGKKTENDRTEDKSPETTAKRSAKNATSAKCGDNVFWTFENGTLTISGTGDVTELDDDWKWENLTTCVIERGVTSIWWILSGCETLTSVSIPDTMTSINDRAFDGCKNLKSITLPDTVTEIGENAFNGCTSLTSITIPNSVTYVGWFAFCGCTNLKNVTISKELYDDIVTNNWSIGSAARFDDVQSINFIFSTQAVNPLTVKGKTATVKYKKLRRKKQALSVSKAISFTKKGQGKLTYAKVSGNMKITINKSTGKITIKKGLRRKTYKVKVKVRAAGNNQYKPSSWKTVTIKIKVK